MDYSIYDYNSDEKLLQEQEIEEINNEDESAQHSCHEAEQCGNIF